MTTITYDEFKTDEMRSAFLLYILSLKKSCGDQVCPFCGKTHSLFEFGNCYKTFSHQLFLNKNGLENKPVHHYLPQELMRNRATWLINNGMADDCEFPNIPPEYSNGYYWHWVFVNAFEHATLPNCRFCYEGFARPAHQVCHVIRCFQQLKQCLACKVMVPDLHKHEQKCPDAMIQCSACNEPCKRDHDKCCLQWSNKKCRRCEGMMGHMPAWNATFGLHIECQPSANRSHLKEVDLLALNFDGSDD